MLLKMAVTALRRQQKVVELLHLHAFISTVELYEQCYIQLAQSRRTPSTPGTTCTQPRASRLETGLAVLPSALTTTSANSGLTTQGRQIYLSSAQPMSQSVQVLDEDLRPGKKSIHNGVNFRTESVWGSRWFQTHPRILVSCRCFVGGA